MENKIFAVKRNNGKWWAAIDCGTTQKGGMAVDNYWLTHFEKDNKTYRWYAELFMPPSDLQEWGEIKVIDKSITVITNDGIMFDGWEDKENAAYETLQKFAKLLGKNMTIDEVRMLINGESKQLNKPAVSVNEVKVCPKCGNTGRCEPRTLSDPDGQECDCGAN